MRLIAALVLLAGCEFSARLDPGARDAEPTPVDAAPDAPDASQLPACPPAPTGCTTFDCAMSPASCYYYCPSERSSGSAQGVCSGIASEACLVTLDDAVESACVRAAAGVGDLIYIGLRQDSEGSEPAGDWGWYCDDSSITATWKPGEPNNAGTFGEDCGAMDTTGLWVDVGCSETFRFICEAPRPEP